MKKIFFIFLLLITACTRQLYMQPPKQIPYAQLPVFELPVERIVIINQNETPHSIEDKKFSLKVEKAIREWGLTRLRANYTTNQKATLIIKKASFQQETQKNYSLDFSIYLNIANTEQEVKLSGIIQKSLPKDATKIQLENMFAFMLNEMQEKLDSQFSVEIKKSLDL